MVNILKNDNNLVFLSWCVVNKSPFKFSPGWIKQEDSLTFTFLFKLTASVES